MNVADADDNCDEASAKPPTPLTLQYLEQSAMAAFEREEDQGESIWRTLPFFGAILGLAATMIEHLAGATPPLGDGFTVAVYALLGGATISFLWAFRWFWSVVWNRDYQYPASERELQAYAEGLTQFHSGQELTGGGLDEAVLADLRIFRMKELSDAARINASNNRRKLLARGQTMLFTLVGFALAFICGALIFVLKVHIAPDVSGVKSAANACHSNSIRQTAAQADTTAAAFRGKGCEASEAQRDTQDMGRRKQVTDKPKTPPPPAKPVPPPPQIVKKSHQPVPPKKS